MAIPITENIYSLAMALMHEGAEIEGHDGIRETTAQRSGLNLRRYRIRRG